MRYRVTIFAVAAFAIGALSDILMIRNGLAYGGPTPLDKHPALWPVWLAFIFVCSCVLDFNLPPGRGFLIPLSILLGILASHTALLIRDVVTDPTSHNLWPFEYLFWGIVVAVPACLGWLLSFLVAKALDRNGLQKNR